LVVPLLRAEAAPEQALAAARGLLALELRWSAVAQLAKAIRSGSQEVAERATDLLHRLGRDYWAGTEVARLSRWLFGRKLDHLPVATVLRLKEIVATHCLETGELSRAKVLLRALPKSADVLYRLALIELHRGRQEQGKRHLRQVMRITGESETFPPVRELAALALARVEHDRQRRLGHSGRLPVEYQAVNESSPAYPLAQQELAWIALDSGQPQRALVHLKMARLARGPSVQLVDQQVLRAAVMLALCQIQRARSLSRRGKASLGALIKEAALFLRNRSDRRLYYFQAASALEGRRGSLSPPLQQALRQSLDFRLARRRVAQLTAERRLLYGEKMSAALGPILRAAIERELVRSQRLAGQMVFRLLTQALSELQELRRRSEEILFEADRVTRQVACGPERERPAVRAPPLQLGSPERG
jgi:hypothetical protein